MDFKGSYDTFKMSLETNFILGGILMVNSKDLRNPEFRKAQGLQFVDEVNEKELSSLAGSGDVHAQTTWPCATVGVSVALCPTTKCTSQC